MTDRKGGGSPPEKLDYEVGYCRPPKATQFKKGQGGNPQGRKRKPKSVQAQVQKLLSTKVRISEGGKPKWLTYQDVIIRAQLNSAAKGDLKSASFLFNLASSPEFADADIIDPNSLSAEDQALFEEMVGQILGDDRPELAAPGKPDEAEHAPLDRAGGDDAAETPQHGPASEGNSHDD